MIYLSRLDLAPRCRRVQAELRDPYQMHRTLSKAFGDAAGEWEAARCLFRVDEAPALCALVQSRVRPDWGRLSVPADYLASPPRVKAFAPRLSPGQRLAFRLRANPTVRRDGRRLGLYREEEQLAWLARKAASNGFRVCSAVAYLEDPVRCHPSSGGAATFGAVRFDGVLSVTDPSFLLAALEGGLGAGKGMGFGLLSLAPAG